MVKPDPQISLLGHASQYVDRSLGVVTPGAIRVSMMERGDQGRGSTKIGAEETESRTTVYQDRADISFRDTQDTKDTTSAVNTTMAAATTAIMGTVFVLV